MSWRLTRGEFERIKGEGNRRALKNLVDSGKTVGLLAYVENEPVGWIAFSPRCEYVRIEHSRILRPVDNEPVWSVACFFVAKQFRRKDFTVKLLKAATAHIADKRGKIIEGYPIDSGEDEMPRAFASTGLTSPFRKARFIEVARRSKTRPVMRYATESKTQNR